jgi:hypothetical protein
MSRDAAVVSTWGPPVRGREAKALEVFMEFLGFWSKRAAEGKCSEPEAMFASDGSGGMSVVRGKVDVLADIWQSDECIRMIEKGQFIVEDLKSTWYWTGEEQIQQLTSMYVEMGQELGYM